MGFVVISVGDERSVAVHRRDRTEEPTVFLTPSVLSFAEDGTVALGDTTVPVASVVRVSTARVGQQQSVADEYRAEDLLAHAANCLVAMVTAQHGSAPTVALTVPDQWGPREHALLRDSFDHTGLHDVVLVADDDARRAFSGLGSSDESVVGVDVALAVGALSILENSAAVDTVDTDAIAVIAAPTALAFSEAPDPSHTAAFSEDTAYSHHGFDAEGAAGTRRRTPLLVVTGAAVAVILISVGVAAALGTFSDGADVSPPPITDAQVPAISSTEIPSPTPPAAAIPFPTAPEPAPATPAENPTAQATERQAPDAPQPAQPEPPPAAPAITTPPPAVTRELPVRPTIPNFTYPTIPNFDRPGR